MEDFTFAKKMLKIPKSDVLLQYNHTSLTFLKGLVAIGTTLKIYFQSRLSIYITIYHSVIMLNECHDGKSITM